MIHTCFLEHSYYMCGTPQSNYKRTIGVGTGPASDRKTREIFKCSGRTFGSEEWFRWLQMRGCQTEEGLGTEVSTLEVWY